LNGNRESLQSGTGRPAKIFFALTRREGVKNRYDDPLAYLTDILRRISTHPARRIEELQSDRWHELREAAAMVDRDQCT
jgi:predicted ArsR family transcriptional regulator